MPRPTNAELSEKATLAEQGLKRCRACREVLPLDRFGSYNRGTDGLRPWCKTCTNAKNVIHERKTRSKYPSEHAARKLAEKHQWIKNNPEKYALGVRKNNLRRYGLTPETFDEMLYQQGGICKICKKPLVQGRDLHVDHDHETGAVRGLLCNNCNVGLGAFRDSPDLLTAATQYLVASR